METAFESIWNTFAMICIVFLFIIGVSFLIVGLVSILKFLFIDAKTKLLELKESL